MQNRKWVEIKLTELGVLTHQDYKICFVLDKSNMFRCGPKNKYVKPLHIIWSKFPSLWGPHNTLHVDDLSRNFTLNLLNGVRVRPFYRLPPRPRKDSDKKVADDVSVGDADDELCRLGRYLAAISGVEDVSQVDHSRWSSR